MKKTNMIQPKSNSRNGTSLSILTFPPFQVLARFGACRIEYKYDWPSIQTGGNIKQVIN